MLFLRGCGGWGLLAGTPVLKFSQSGCEAARQSGNRKNREAMVFVVSRIPKTEEMIPLHGVNTTSYVTVRNWSSDADFNIHH